MFGVKTVSHFAPWEMGNRLGEDTAGTHPMMLCSTAKLQGKEDKGGISNSCLRCLSSQVTITQAFQKVAKHLPADRRQWITLILLCLHAELCFTYYIVFILIPEFLSLSPSVVPWSGELMNSFVGLSYWPFFSSTFLP